MKPPPQIAIRIGDDRLAETVRRLVAALSPLAIYLFGSQLTGFVHRDSDIDVLVVMEELQPGSDQFTRAYAALHGLGLPVELHFSSRARFERFADVIGSLSHEIHRKGVLLYAAEA